MRLARILIFIPFIAAIAWIGIVNLYGWGDHRDPVPVGFDYALNDNLKLPKEVIDKAYAAANESALDQSQTGTRFRLVGDIASWIG